MYGLYDPQNRNFYNVLHLNSNFLGTLREFCKFNSLEFTSFDSEEKAKQYKKYLLKRIKEVIQKNLKRYQKNNFSKQHIKEYKNKTDKLYQRFKRLTVEKVQNINGKFKKVS